MVTRKTINARTTAWPHRKQILTRAQQHGHTEKKYELAHNSMATRKTNINSRTTAWPHGKQILTRAQQHGHTENKLAGQNKHTTVQTERTERQTKLVVCINNPKRTNLMESIALPF